jgi:hypothetical protein
VLAIRAVHELFAAWRIDQALHRFMLAMRRKIYRRPSAERVLLVAELKSARQLRGGPNLAAAPLKWEPPDK